MLRVEWKDYNGKWHTYYVKGTSVSRTLKRERRRLVNLHREIVKYMAVEKV